MLVFTAYQGLPEEARGAVAALGNFDGVHNGHAALIRLARQAADMRSAPLAVITFEPHPRDFFQPDCAPFRLTTRETKRALLEAIGVDIVYELPFDQALSRMDATEFQEQVLVNGLGILAVATGENFRFGRGREGTLADLCANPSFTGMTAPAVTDTVGKPISSSRIRQALSKGRMADAANMLGRLWEVGYIVETGDRRGRELGFPTANGRLGQLLRPLFGIYAVLAQLEDGRTFKGVANIGIRPMWQSTEPLIETFLFDFSGDLYGQKLKVTLARHLRPEAKFDNIEELVNQMHQDCIQARDVLEFIG